MNNTLTINMRNANRAIGKAANDLGLYLNDVRCLLCLAEYADISGDEMDTYEFEKLTDILASNVRRSLYALEDSQLIEFVQKRRGQVLIVRLTPYGKSAAVKALREWAKDA